MHCAGAVGTWGRYQDFHQGNVVLTENVVEGCIKEHVRRLVHLSSPSVYFTGRSRLDIREDQLPRRFHDHYALTKHLAEQKVFGAQNSAWRCWRCARASSPVQGMRAFFRG